VIHDERESQLSAMFDGELPATECELLSRRIDRDENLRGRWSRYALIGAAMRSEPVATARSGFARRVSAALRGGETRMGASRGPRGMSRIMLNTAVSASLVVAVAGLSITLLRYTAAGGGSGPSSATAPGVQAAAVVPMRSTGDVRDGALLASSMVAGAATASAATAASGASVANGAAAGSGAAARRGSNGEPVSYVTPASVNHAATALRTELADFIVAHSQYSTPLMRRNLLSALISSEDAVDIAAPGAAVTASPSGSAAGALHATIAASASSR
jgi:sigma-E factor negative regulatory protein RseA